MHPLFTHAALFLSTLFPSLLVALLAGWLHGECVPGFDPDKTSGLLQSSKAQYDDGLVELYALTKGALKVGWTSESVPEHTLRLGQGAAVRLCMQGDVAKGANKGQKVSASDADAKVFILVDGDVWWQTVPVPSTVSSTMSAKNALAVRP